MSDRPADWAPARALLPPGIRPTALDPVRVRMTGAGLLGPDGRPISASGPGGRPPMPSGSGPGGMAWMGPGTPIQPMAPWGDVAGRQFDYPVTWNVTQRPRSHEAITFPQLRALAAAYDPVALAIETRLDQMAGLGWSIQPKKLPGQRFRRKTGPECAEAERFFRKPDRRYFWDQWIRAVVRDQLEIDAATLYRRLDKGGRTYGAEFVDGASILPLLDKGGRQPIDGEVAYQQFLKGVPAVEYTAGELLYAPRNVRSNSRYGKSPTEQIITTVNIGIRRQLGQLGHHTEGNVPEALIGLPESWTVEQVQKFQAYWDALTADPMARRKARFVPGQFAFQPTRNESGLMDQFDEWLVRIVCYAFSLPPLPFVKVMNRSTAESSYDAALKEGLAPLMKWAKNIHDEILTAWLGHEDIEWVWDDIRDLDPTEQIGVDMQELQRGIVGLDDLRERRGLEPVGLGPVVYGVGPMGFMSPEQMARAIADGLTEIQPPPSPEMMGMGPAGFPPGMDPQGDPLAGADPRLMAMLGQQRGGADAPPVEEGEHEEEDDEVFFGDHPEGMAEAGFPAPPPMTLSPAVARRLGGVRDPAAFVRSLLGRAPPATRQARSPRP